MWRFPPGVDLLSPLRRSVLGLLGAGLGVALLAALARSDEVAARSSALGFVIHGPEETLRDFCREEDGALYLVIPDGVRFELITSTSDPAIANPGDGSFHPFDESVVREALGTVRFPLAGVSAHVFILPYPRRVGLRSAAGSQLILLAPGVAPLPAEQQHATLVHELGHVVQYALMPDQAGDLWERYRELRGITDVERYRDDGAHADRPHEIFAEDFRALFGGPLANYSGAIENPGLCHPSQVQGLEAFVVSLAGGAPIAAAVGLRGYPNPTRGTLSFRAGGGQADALDLFDLAGRRVATLTPTPLAEGWAWLWDGRDQRGSRVGAGVVFARLRGSAEPALRIVVAR